MGIQSGYVTDSDTNLEDCKPYLCGWPKFVGTAVVRRAAVGTVVDGIAVVPAVSVFLWSSRSVLECFVRVERYTG